MWISPATSPSPSPWSEFARPTRQPPGRRDAKPSLSEGKWRLTVSSAAPLAVMSLVEDAEGALSNLSTPGRR